MDPLLSGISAALTGLGPWGVLIGAGLTLGVQYLRNRVQPAPVAPAPPAPPVPVPSPAPTGTPVLDMLRHILPLLLQIKLAPPAAAVTVAPPVAADVHPDDAAELLLKFFGKK